MDDLALLAFEHAPIGMIYSEDRVIRRCNPRLCTMFGYPVDRLQDASLSLLYPTPAEFDRIGQLGAARMKGSGRYDDERIMRRSDGRLFWCRVRGQSLEAEHPFARAVWTFADLSEVRPTADLSLRERQVAKMMAEGLTSKEIAQALEISHRTVEVHRGRLMSKMEARNSMELVARLVGLPLFDRPRD